MKNFFRSISILCILVSLFSCQLFEKPKDIPVTDISQLKGYWEEGDVSYTYPYVDNGKNYLSICHEYTNDWELWDSYARKKQLTVEELLQKQNAAVAQVYNKDYPYEASDGVVTLRNLLPIPDIKQLYSSELILVPEEVVNAHLDLFSIKSFRDVRLLQAQAFVEFITASHQLPPAAGEYGLVLAGGGGKGAYQVGAWKALWEYGIGQKVSCFSGASVGGLNAGLFTCCKNPEEIQKIWLDEVPDQLTKNDALLSQEGLLEIINSIDIQKLQINTFPYIYVDALREKKLFSRLVNGSGLEYFLVNKQSEEQIKNLFLATSAFPVVTTPVLLEDGYYYSDGGNELLGGDNTPFYPITEIRNPKLEIKTLIIISLNDADTFELEPEDTVERLIHIVPSEDLGAIREGTLNFTREKSEHLIDLGYADTVKVLEAEGFVPVNPDWFLDQSDSEYILKE